MKTINSLITLILVLVCNATAEIHDTNAKLPDNKQITPFSEVKMGPKTVRVDATFSNQKKVISYNQGNFCTIIYLVTYKLENKDKRFPKGTITFLARDSVPAEGSGIKNAKAAWPFQEGMMTFLLEPDKYVTFRNFYHVLSYKALRIKTEVKD